jgi:hypothetical protein
VFGTWQICIFAYFREKNTFTLPNSRSPGAVQDLEFNKYVMDPLEAALYQYETQLTPVSLCIVFTPAANPPPANVFKYRARIEGSGSINEAIQGIFPDIPIINMGYNYPRSVGDMAYEGYVGKIVLEWIGATSSCGTGGISVLNVFAEDDWWRAIPFDGNGNPITEQQTPCESPAGAEDVFDN